MEPKQRVRANDSAQTLSSGGGGILTLEEPKRPLAIFETELKVAICRDVMSSSPVNFASARLVPDPGKPNVRIEVVDRRAFITGAAALMA
jgi:hypothetical protein